MRYGVKIEIEIPDWCDERHIYILAGIEMVAYKLYGQTVWCIKETRCNMCGACCENLRVQPLPFEDITDALTTDCQYLELIGTEKACSLGMHRPVSCSVGLQEDGRTPNCCIKYKRV